MEKNLLIPYKQLFLFVLGGSLYYMIEILYRGYSHWTRFMAGGIIFLFAGYQSHSHSSDYPFWKETLHVWLFALCIEFSTGCLVNLRLGWNVWDYSNLPFNLFGQVCLPFALMFLPLCAAAIILDNYICYWLFQDKKPKYKIF